MMGGGAGAYALHWSRGAARCVRSHIPGALSILKGAVPDRARGLGHMAPTYFRREPGIDAPTAIAAPCFIFPDRRRTDLRTLVRGPHEQQAVLRSAPHLRHEIFRSMASSVEAAKAVIR